MLGEPNFFILHMGRRTYQLIEEFWPNAETDPKTSAENVQVAKMMNATKKIVASRTPEKAEPQGNWKNVELVHELYPESIRNLKEQDDKGIWVAAPSPQPNSPGKAL